MIASTSSPVEEGFCNSQKQRWRMALVQAFSLLQKLSAAGRFPE
jgi:hypothetical protein